LAPIARDQTRFLELHLAGSQAILFFNALVNAVRLTELSLNTGLLSDWVSPTLERGGEDD
jgi:hypothetical protein